MNLAALRSPVCSFAEHIIGSVASIAPERADELRLRSIGVSFRFSTLARYDFASKPASRRIYVPIRGVEYLWVLAFTSWLLYRHYSESTAPPREIVFKQHPEARFVPALLRWSAVNQHFARYRPWPSGLPRPDPLAGSDASNPSTARIATELALCGAAWSLHRELAHIENADPPNAADSIQRETRADHDASAWLLDQAPPGLPLIKRALGIAIGTIALARLELGQAQRPTVRTHPNPAQRIFVALDQGPLATDTVAHTVAAFLLSCVMQEAGLAPPTVAFATAKDCVADYYTILQRHLA